MENTVDGEWMEKLCHAKEVDEEGKDNGIRIHGYGNLSSVERIGKGIAQEIIPFVPVKITISFRSFRFGILPTMQSPSMWKNGSIFASAKGKQALLQALLEMLEQPENKQ